VRTICIVTGGRADYGIYLPILRKIQEDSELDLRLIVTGSHLSSEFGSTIRTIENDGFQVSDRVEILAASDTPQSIARSMGLGTIGFSQSFDRDRPDILLLQGDRFEIHAAAVAALPFNIPVAHIHGGELTEGAIDDALRHSITKLSHFHFVANEEYRRRVIQLGEEPWRVVISGAPSLENLSTMSLMTREELEAQTGLNLERRPLLVTYHPVTLEYQRTEWQVAQLLDAVKSSGMPVVFTAPNADTGGRVIKEMLKDYVQSDPQAQLVDNLGTLKYFSLMAIASAMVGNSSSGLVEAPSLALPVVNIGARQQGRLRAQNVIDVGYNKEDILEGIGMATDPVFVRSLQDMANPYGDGQASTIIVDRLKSTPLDAKLLRKRFYDVSLDSVAK
jgi:UDP-hydrolysing UDP-N-acetyl-D-glucosamine 2-epimerase